MYDIRVEAITQTQHQSPGGNQSPLFDFGNQQSLATEKPRSKRFRKHFPNIIPKSVRKQTRGWSPYCRTLVNTWGQHWVYEVPSCLRKGKQPLHEPQKVAINSNRLHAFLSCTIHFIPVLASLTLFVLNMRAMYVGGELIGANGEDEQKLGALSFVAKLHELMMQASLAAIILTQIRNNVISSDGVPFGAMFSALSFVNVTYLWARDFRGVMTATWSHRRKKWRFIALVFISTLLAVAVGPSSSNLMKPRLDDWSAGGTSFWLGATPSTMFPAIINDSTALAHCAQETADVACPHHGWEVINEQHFESWPQLKAMGLIPGSVRMSSAYATREHFIGTRKPDDVDARAMYYGCRTLSTVPMAATADGLISTFRLWAVAAANTEREKRYWTRKDVKFTVRTQQPVVMSRCRWKGVPAPVNLTAEFPVLSTFDMDDMGIDVQVYTVNRQHTNYTQSVTNSLLSNGSVPQLHWYTERDLHSLQVATNSTINAVVVFPRNKYTNGSIFSCSIDSRLANTTLLTARSAVGQVSSTLNPASFLGDIDNSYLDPQTQGWPQIAIDASWLRYLNPVTSNNLTILSNYLRTAGVNTGVWPGPYSSTSYTEIIVEDALAQLISNGLGRASYNTTLAGTLRGSGKQPWGGWTYNGWMEYLLPASSHAFGPGGDAWTLTPDEQARSTELRMQATITGYAYSSRGALQQFAMAVLLLYVIIALGHCIYVIFFNATASTAWDSTPEIAALAINSPPTRLLENTGAGVYSSAVFENVVRIRSRGLQKLEFVFEDTRVGDDSFIVQKNTAYG